MTERATEIHITTTVNGFLIEVDNHEPGEPRILYVERSVTQLLNRIRSLFVEPSAPQAQPEKAA
jgi:hypothetical protein